MSKIENIFFKTFDIPTLCTSTVCNSWGNCKNCLHYPSLDRYPEITDSILLNLLCIINKYGNIVSSYNIEKLKDEILIKTITLSKDIDIKPQVRALFSNK